MKKIELKAALANAILALVKKDLRINEVEDMVRQACAERDEALVDSRKIEKNLDHWRDEVGKLNATLGREVDETKLLQDELAKAIEWKDAKIDELESEDSMSFLNNMSLRGHIDVIQQQLDETSNQLEDALEAGEGLKRELRSNRIDFWGMASELEKLNDLKEELKTANESAKVRMDGWNNSSYIADLYKKRWNELKEEVSTFANVAELMEALENA